MSEKQLRVAISGSGGFLGWHVRAALREVGANVVPIPLGTGYDPGAASKAMSGADLVLHLAGVNRGTDSEVSDGNALFAGQLADAMKLVDRSPARVVYAGTVHRTGVYGEAKSRAGERVASAAAEAGAADVGVELPNLFGEHGRPFYNSVTATFCHQLSLGETPAIDVDRELQLLHAQDAADVIIGSAPVAELESRSRRLAVSDLLGRLRSIADCYAIGDIPDLGDPFAVALFNTFRSFAHAVTPTHPLARHADERGSFFEVVRSHGGEGQTSFSTSVPGVIRGGHFHRRKIERFTVLAGSGRISMRRLFAQEVESYEVTGDEPVSVDMPTMWPHEIVNTGHDTLYLGFWISEIFRPERPDTIPEAV